MHLHTKQKLHKSIKYLERKFANIKLAFGLQARRKSADRLVLEQEIIPYFANKTTKLKILFIGCDWYTQDYQRLFSKHQYWTIDKNPKCKRYGAYNHVTASMTELNDYFSKNFFDLIICNGVFGWGLNNKEEADRAFMACYNVMANLGILIIGWNDVPGRVPTTLAECIAIAKFKPYSIPLYRTHELRVSTCNNHVYNFYKKVRS